MEEWDTVTTRDADEKGEQEGVEDCIAADGNIAELLPISPLKCGGVATEHENLEEQPATITMPISPKSTDANTSDGVEHANMDSTLLNVLSQSSVPISQESVANSARADQHAKITSDSVLNVLEESSGSDSVPTPSKPNTANADQEANNDSDSVLTVVLDEESSGSNSVLTSPKSSESSTASSDVFQKPNTDCAAVLNEILGEEGSRGDKVPTSQKSAEPNIASADVAQAANNDAPALNEEQEEKPSTSGSVSIWEKSLIPSTMNVAFKAADADPNKVKEEEVMPATDENQHEDLILNDTNLLAQSLIAKLMNLLVAKGLSEVNVINNNSNSRKRPSSDISVAGASCGSSASDALARGPPAHTITSESTLMEYYIYKKKAEGKDCDFSQLLIDNPGLLQELNFYTERMKSFIMLPIKQAKEPEETEAKRARQEDETNGAETSNMTDLT